MAIITEIKKTTKNKSQMYEIFVDGESLGLYHIETIIKHSIKVGMEVDVAVLDNALKESTTLVAMEKVLNYISKSMKTQKDIEKYLKGKGYGDDIIESVIAKLREYNYINDEIYAKYFIASKSKKEGNKKIKFDLKNKGLDEKVIAEMLSENAEDLDVIKNLADKYLKNKVKDFKTKTKLFAFLASKGFEYENINSVLRQYDFSGNNEDAFND